MVKDQAESRSLPTPKEPRPGKIPGSPRVDLRSDFKKGGESERKPEREVRLRKKPDRLTFKVLTPVFCPPPHRSPRPPHSSGGSEEAIEKELSDLEKNKTWEVIVSE